MAIYLAFFREASGTPPGRWEELVNGNLLSVTSVLMRAASTEKLAMSSLLAIPLEVRERWYQFASVAFTIDRMIYVSRKFEEHYSQE